MTIPTRNPAARDSTSESAPLKMLFIGDVVGSPGRKIVGQVLPRIIPRWELGLVVCNAENAAGGSGLTVGCFEELLEAGVDVMTMGDHVYRKDEIFQVFDRTGAVLRPANFPPDAPGPELFIATARDGTSVGVFTLVGRVFLKPADCPFRTADRLLERIGGDTPVVVVDVHAEATSEKQLLGRYLDGRVSAVLGTHTHVATADEQILKQGTAYQTDVGMTGPHDSILGRRYDRVLSSTLTLVPAHFDVATGDPRFNGALVTIDTKTGKALSISRVSLKQDDVQRLMTESTGKLKQ
jgi:metallophosphoesterase (TIGR00282 family)